MAIDVLNEKNGRPPVATTASCRSRQPFQRRVEPFVVDVFAEPLVEVYQSLQRAVLTWWPVRLATVACLAEDAVRDQ